MYDTYAEFFKRENFIQSLKAARQRKLEWEERVRQKWEAEDRIMAEIQAGRL